MRPVCADPEHGACSTAPSSPSTDRRAIMTKMKAKGQSSMRSLRSLRSIFSLRTSSRSLRFKQSTTRTSTRNNDGSQDGTGTKAGNETAKRAGLHHHHHLSLRSLRSLFSASTSTAAVSTRSSIGGGQLGASSSSPLLMSELPSPIRAAGFGISTAPSTADAVQEAVSLAMRKAHAQQQQQKEDRKGCFANCYDDDEEEEEEEEQEDRRSRRSSGAISISSIRGSLRSSVSSLSSSVRRHRRRSSSVPVGSSSARRPPRLVPLIAFVSADTGRDVDEVQREFVRALPPGTPIHGVTSAGKLLTTDGAVPGSVGCLVLCGEEDEGEEEERKMKGEGGNSRSTACATGSPVFTPTNTDTCSGDRRISGNSDSSSLGFATAYTADGTTAAGAAELASALHAKMGSPQAIVMGTVPGAEEGILDALERQFPGTPIWGGTAGDDKLEGYWSVLSECGASGLGASVVAIGRDVRFGASMAASYAKPTEKRGVVTKADGRKVMEIDGQHADDWVYDWLGEDVKTEFEQGGLILDKTCRHAIGIRRPESGEIITCHLAAFGGQENWTGFDYESWVEFFAPIPVGSELIVMNDEGAPSMGYRDALVSAHKEALSSLPLSAAGDEHDRDDNDSGGDAYDDAISSPKAGILVLCGGMALATGNRLDVGLKDETFVQELGTVPMLGLTCFGEQGYLPRAKRSAQRNLSVGMLLFA